MNPRATLFLCPDGCRGYADYVQDRDAGTRSPDQRHRNRITRWLLLRTANVLDQPRHPYPEGT